MSPSDADRSWEALLALAPEEDSLRDEQLQAVSPLPSLAERVDLFLRAVYGSDREFTSKDRELARDRILNAMASEIIDERSSPEADNFGRNKSALFMPLFALLVEGVPLREQQQKAWFTNPEVRNDFDRLKLELQAKNSGLGFNAAAAAASSGENRGDDRRLDGGGVRVRHSSREGQVFVILNLEAPSAIANPPSALLLEGPEHELVRMELPKPDASGKIILIKDLAQDEDALLIRLLRNPFTVGTFLS